MKRHEHIPAFFIETLLLVQDFVSVILVLTGVFGLARRRSGEAKLLTNAVTLAQNAAEAVAAADSDLSLLKLLDERDNAVRLRDTAGVMAFYDTEMRPDSKGALRVDVTWLPTQTDTGTLVQSVIEVRYNGQPEPVYRLDTAAYLRGVTP